MSVAVGQLGPDFAVVAADLRWGRGQGSPDIEGEPWIDLGGKLLQVEPGWAAWGASGCARFAQLAALTAGLEDDGGPARFIHTFRELRESREAPEDVRAHLLVAGWEDGEGDGAPFLHQVDTAGAMDAWPPGRLALLTPSDVEMDQVDTLREDLSGAEELGEAVRRVTRAAEAIADTSPLVSPEVVVGAVSTGGERLFWRGPAGELAEAGDESLLQASSWRFTIPPEGLACQIGGTSGVSLDPWELYTVDNSDDSDGLVLIGARKEGGGDFQVKKSGETLTVPGSEVTVQQATDYFVYWERGQSTISVTQNKEDIMDWKRVWLIGPNSDGTITSTLDGNTTPDTGGGTDDAGRGGFQ